MFKKYALLLCVLLQMGVAYADNAVGKEDLKVTLQQFKVVRHASAEALEPATTIKPGETIEYQAVYQNTTTHLISKLQATLPIPKETEYLPNTAKPAGVLASLDGVTYAPVPLRRMVKLASGKMVEQDVPVVEYRSLRWTLGDLPAKQKIMVSARMRLAPVGQVVAGGAKK